jgi:hypothetical protein
MLLGLPPHGTTAVLGGALQSAIESDMHYSGLFWL